MNETEQAEFDKLKARIGRVTEIFKFGGVIALLATMILIAIFLRAFLEGSFLEAAFFGISAGLTASATVDTIMRIIRAQAAIVAEELIVKIMDSMAKELDR